MDTNAIINAAMQQLVTTVADEVIRRLKAEATATATLEPEQLQFAMLHLLESDTLIREEVLNISEQKFNEIDARLDHIENDDAPTCNVDISDNDDFTDLKSVVEDLVSRVEDFETNGTIDADDSDFQDAVRSVIRNHI
jgi:Zn finger protein HypA/HybF involved in hydrogenase expression